MVITIDIVLNIYSSILSGAMSYSEADRWAWDVIQLFDDGEVEFKPKEEEELLWDLVQFLHGIDMPSIANKNITMLSNIDIINFLVSKNVYKLLK
jgi:hypothetical protein